MMSSRQCADPANWSEAPLDSSPSEFREPIQLEVSALIAHLRITTLGLVARPVPVQPSYLGLILLSRRVEGVLERVGLP